MVCLPLLDTFKSVARQQGEEAPQNHQSFTSHELRTATKNFDKKNVIGSGSFGKVYKGVLKNGIKVAVKRKKPNCQQGENEFHVEIRLLAGLQQHNLVKLIGYCDEDEEMMLVYEYMENGSLKSHLYGSDKPLLSWKQRLEICAGVAKGLDYLHRLHYVHTGSTNAIIHRDIKSENILLDGNLCAKVGDFGISKTGPELDQTHVSTLVKGTPGYLDPEYYRTQHLTEKSDVYSFGAVLLEVLCARPVIDNTLPEGQTSLAEWGMKMIKKGELTKIVDQRISGTIKQRSLELFGEIVEKCLAEKRADRTSMENILKDLEHIQKSEDMNALRRCEGKKNFTRASSVPADPHGPSTSQVPSEESDDGVSSQPIINPGKHRALTRCPHIKLP